MYIPLSNLGVRTAYAGVLLLGFDERFARSELLIGDDY